MLLFVLTSSTRSYEDHLLKEGFGLVRRWRCTVSSRSVRAALLSSLFCLAYLFNKKLYPLLRFLSSFPLLSWDGATLLYEKVLAFQLVPERL
jgi:hypothetical protein